MGNMRRARACSWATASARIWQAQWRICLRGLVWVMCTCMYTRPLNTRIKPAAHVTYTRTHAHTQRARVSEGKRERARESERGRRAREQGDRERERDWEGGREGERETRSSSHHIERSLGHVCVGVMRGLVTVKFALHAGKRENKRSILYQFQRVRFPSWECTQRGHGIPQ
jgi:hypothetical protein